MANKERVNTALLMQKVFGDRLNGLSEAEIAYVQEVIAANLDKVKSEAKERAAWADVLIGLAGVIDEHGKTDVVEGKVLRLTFDNDGYVSTFKIQKVRSATGGNTSGMVKQYRKKGSEKWIDCPSNTYVGACNVLNFPTNGGSGNAVLKSKGYETQAIEIAAVAS